MKNIALFSAVLLLAGCQQITPPGESEMPPSGEPVEMENMEAPMTSPVEGTMMEENGTEEPVAVPPMGEPMAEPEM